MSGAPEVPAAAIAGGAGRAVNRRLWFVSGVSYAAAFLLTTVLHELAHYVVALGWGRDPTLFHNSVQSALQVSNGARITTSLAGPVFSLVQGVALLPLERRLRAAAPELRLLVVWLAFHGLMNATGYLFTTAFVPDADMGSAARRLGVPLWGMLALSGLGFWAIRVAAHWVYPAFVALLPREARLDVSARNRGLVQLALLAWPVGVLLVLPASLPVPHWLSLLYVLIAGIGSVWFTDFSKANDKAGTPPIEATETSTPGGVQVRLPALNLGVWLGLTLLCLLVLRHGVHFQDSRGATSRVLKNTLPIKNHRARADSHQIVLSQNPHFHGVLREHGLVLRADQHAGCWETQFFSSLLVCCLHSSLQNFALSIETRNPATTCSANHRFALLEAEYAARPLAAVDRAQGGAHWFGLGSAPQRGLVPVGVRVVERG